MRLQATTLDLKVTSLTFNSRISKGWRGCSNVHLNVKCCDSYNVCAVGVGSWKGRIGLLLLTVYKAPNTIVYPRLRINVNVQIASYLNMSMSSQQTTLTCHCRLVIKPSKTSAGIIQFVYGQCSFSTARLGLVLYQRFVLTSPPELDVSIRRQLVKSTFEIFELNSFFAVIRGKFSHRYCNERITSKPKCNFHQTS